MCRVLQVSASGYYYWLHHPLSLREQKEQELVAQIKEVYQQGKCRYGSPRISSELGEQGLGASRPRVAHVMQKHQIQRIIRDIGCRPPTPAMATQWRRTIWQEISEQ